MSRKREFDEDRMLAVIRDQFRSQGYEGTSTYDLMAATGLGKGSIYMAYGNKHELYLRTVDNYCDGIVGEAQQALSAEADPSPTKRIETYLVDAADVFSRQPPPIGCYLTKATVDRAATDDAVATIVKNAYDNLAAAFEAAVQEAQAAGEIDPDADGQALSYLLVAVTRGMDCLARAGTAGEVLDRVADTALTALFQRPQQRCFTDGD